MSKDLVKTNNDVATVPNYLNDIDLSGPTGLEAITTSDMKIPRLAIAQKMHSETDEDSAAYIPGLKPGMFFNTLSKDVYGKGPLVITPLVSKLHQRYFSPRDQGSKTLCISENGIDGGRISPLCFPCPKNQWGFDEEKQKPIPPLCTKFWTYMILLHISETVFIPMVLSLKRAMIPQAEEFNTFMRQRRIGGKLAPAYTGIYEVSTFPDKATGGDFYNIKFVNAAWISKELVNNVKMLFDEYGPKVHEASNTIDAEVIEKDDDSVPF